MAPEVAAPFDHDVERLPHVVAGQSGGLGSRSRQRPVLAIRHAAALRGGNSRFDPRPQRPPQFQNVRAECFSRHLGRGVGGTIGSRRRVGEIFPARTSETKHLHPRQAVAHDADPGRLRRCRQRLELCGSIYDNPADASLGHAQRGIRAFAVCGAGGAAATRSGKRSRGTSAPCSATGVGSLARSRKCRSRAETARHAAKTRTDSRPTRPSTSTVWLCSI